MQLTARPLPLHLKTPFKIAYGTSTMRENVLVQIGSGFGEGALPPYYGYKLEDVLRYLSGIDVEAILGDDPYDLENALQRIPPGPAPARAAVDLALHDLWGQRLGQPLYRLFGLGPASAPPSSLTLSIPDSEDALREAVRAAGDYPVLKLKLGSGSTEKDERIVRTVREETAAELCVDANGAWTLAEAAHIIPRLSAYSLSFVEQPLPKDLGPEAWHRLRAQLPSDALPLIADESVQSAQDVLALAGAADGINVKLAKTGGLRGARRMIELARALGMRVMIGCMIESAVAVTAAAHLAPLADYADLDGNVHVLDDPFFGMKLDQGRIILPSLPGLGLTKRDAADTTEQEHLPG